MSYYPFSVDERERARRTDLVELLRRCGEEVKPSGSEFQWQCEGQKVTIRGNLWFHHYEQVGGDAVDFMARFYGLNYIQSIKTLLGLCAPTIREAVVPFEQKPLEIPPMHDNMRRVYAYLCRQREIAKEVLDYFVYRRLVYESSDYHNAVFVGYDSEGKMRHLHKHSTASRGGFKGNAPGSRPEHSFHWTGADDTLFLFEAPIDLLSFITLHPSGWRNHSYAACCGVCDRVLWQRLEEQPYLKQVYICMDSDEPGQRAANLISENLSANRAVFYCDELGTMPPFDILPLFSAGRSRRLSLVPIIQSLAQLEKNYGKEGAEIMQDNCQDTIFGGFAPNSKTAEALSANLGNRTVLSGQITQNKDNPSQSLQMMQRPLMTADELKSMPKGSFVVMKTGSHPVKVKLKLFLKWGIRFEKPLVMPDQGSRPVYYASKSELEAAIIAKYPLIRMEPVQSPVNKNLKMQQQQQQKTANLKTKT